MAFSNSQLSNRDYPAIMQLVQRCGRWLWWQHCLQLIEKSLWWCVALLLAGTVVHSAITALNPIMIIGLATTPLIIALIIALFSGRLSLNEVAQRCDRWLNSKQLYTTAAEYLTDNTNNQNRLASDFVLTQAEQLSRQWLPRIRQIQRWQPSPWLAIPLSISIAALFFQTLPGKQHSIRNDQRLETQLLQQSEPAAAKDDLATRLESALKQLNQPQPLADNAATRQSSVEEYAAASSNDSIQPAAINASKQLESSQHHSDTLTAESRPGHSNTGSTNTTQTGASDAESLADERQQPLTDPELAISFYDIGSGNLSGTGTSASGQTQALTPSASTATPIQAAPAANLVTGKAPQYALQTSPQQRHYLNKYFNRLKAEQ